MDEMMRERLASSSSNARELRKLRALEKIANHLEVISTTLGMWHAEQRGDCDPFESPALLRTENSMVVVSPDDQKEK